MNELLHSETQYCCYIPGCNNKLRNGIVVGKCNLHRNYNTCEVFGCKNIFLKEYMKMSNLCQSCENKNEIT